jgi:hypothetical protein
VSTLKTQRDCLEKQEQTKPKTSRRREIIKIKAKINEIEIKGKRPIYRINEKRKVHSLKRKIRLINP